MERMLSDAEVMEIGKKLRELREKLGYTQQEFANKLYWDVSSYQKIESGKTLMTLVQREKSENVPPSAGVCDPLGEYEHDERK